MPWLSIIMALVTFLTAQRKKGANTARSAAIAGLAGLGTYYVSHETEWGQTTLGALDGVITTPPVTAGGTDVPQNADGTPGTRNADGSYTVVGPNGENVVVRPGSVGGTINGAPAIANGGVTVPSTAGGFNGSTAGLWSTLQSWGPTGTAAVIGTTAVATDSSFRKYLPWAAGAVALLLILK